MKKILPLLFLCLAVPGFAQVQTAADGFSAKVRGIDVKVEFYTPDIVRVLKTTATSNLEQKKDYVVELAPQHPSVQVSTSGNLVRAVSSRMEVTMDLGTGKIQFNDLKGLF